MYERTESELGIYAKTVYGDRDRDEFFYTLPNRPRHYVRISPGSSKITVVQSDDRAGWRPVGPLWKEDGDYEIVIGVDTVTRHLGRIADGLLNWLDDANREKDHLNQLLADKSSST
jgi:hypothetical protein